MPGYEALHRMVAAELGEHLPQQAALLVLGAGTGMEIGTLRAIFQQWRFTGVEPSADMVKIARERLREVGLAGRAELVEGYLEALPPSVRFDGATVILVMHFLPDDGAKAQLLQEVAKRLRPGARMILVDQHGIRPSAGFDSTIEVWKKYQVLAGYDQEAVDTAMLDRLGNLHYIPENRVVALLEEAGFEDVERFYQAFVFGGWRARRAG